MPERVQLSRKAGWRMPPNTVKVSRPGRFGNPFAAKIPSGETGLATMTREYLVADFREWVTTPVMDWPDRPAFAGGDTARTHLMGVPFEGRPTLDEIQSKLRGHNLACWCPLSQPCHADVLLELANADTALAN